MVWTIEFTAQFEKELKQLTTAMGTAWLSELDNIKDYPFNVNASSLKEGNPSKGYRWRKGELTINFRLQLSSSSILLISANQLKNKTPLKAVDESSKGMLSQLLKSIAQLKDTAPTQDLLDAGGIENLPVTIEEILLDQSDLYLLSIPDHYHPYILECNSFELARARGVPADICDRIEEYVRSPSQHQIGRIYSLSHQDSLLSIACEPLRKFLAVLDPQQKSIVDKSISAGPMLIRGGPGTGKTLINLARINKIREEEESKTLLNAGQIRVGFITFNKALSLSAKSMYDNISKKTANVKVEFKTLDSITYQLGSKITSSQPEIASQKNQIDCLRHIVSSLGESAEETSYIATIVQRRGWAFILEEFEQIIVGNNLLELTDYQEFPRKGRKTPLQIKERNAIHLMFKAWIKALRSHNFTTFALRRLKILRAMEKEQLAFQKYDFLFVDELQDLSVVAIRIVTRLVSDVRFLTFTADTAQSIYLKSPSWNGIYPDLRFHAGNSFILRNSYRMTKQIAKAIQPLRLNAGDAEKDDDGINNAVFSGELPYWVHSPAEKHLSYTADIISRLINVLKINPGQIAIMVPDIKLTESAMSQMSSAGIAAETVNRANAIDLDAPHVHILTPHAAKGLEFPFVFALYVTSDKYPQKAALLNCMDELQQSEEMDKAKRLLYVALSRAARSLWMFTDNRSPCLFLQDLNQQDWNRQILS